MLEQPCLEVEAVRIDVAVRPLEPQRQAPALARVYFRRGAGNLPFAHPRGEPRDRYPMRDARARRCRPLDREREVRSDGGILRQVVDDTRHPDVALFPRRSELVGKPAIRAPRGVEEAHEPGRECNGDHARRIDRRRMGAPDARECEDGCGRHAKRDDREPARGGRQAQTPLQKRRADGRRHEQGGNRKLHADARRDPPSGRSADVARTGATGAIGQPADAAL